MDLNRYLVRIEHIAIHSASYYGGAQVYSNPILRLLMMH